MRQKGGKQGRTVSALESALSPLFLRHRAEEEAAGLPALMAEAERAVTTLFTGEHRQRKAGTGDNFWQFRDYVSGTDRPQDIDWRQSARGDRAFVRQKELQTAQTVLFWLQNDRGMTLKTGDALYSKYDSAVILSLALSILLTRNGENIGAIDSSLRAGRGEAALKNLGEVLTNLPHPLPVTPHFPVTETLPRRSSLILSGDFLQPPEEIERGLAPLAAQAPHGLLFQILDPAEYDLPYNGRVIFRAFDDSRDYSIANVPSIRDAYRTRLQSHIESVRILARRYNYAHILHITRDDPRHALSAAWQAMSPQLHIAGGGAS